MKFKLKPDQMPWWRAVLIALFALALLRVSGVIPMLLG